MKKELISQIQEIIKEYGSFTTREVEADYSPSVESKGSLIHLIWCMNYSNVEVEVLSSGGDETLDEYDLTYEELDIDTLTYILQLAETWKEISLEDDEDDIEDALEEN